MKEVIEILNEIGYPFAYSHFAEGESPKPPFICYLVPMSNNFSSDGIAYFKKCKFQIEVYTDYKDLEIENKVESVLDKHRIFYDKTETYIENEMLYETIYEFEKAVEKP